MQGQCSFTLSLNYERYLMRSAIGFHLWLYWVIKHVNIPGVFSLLPALYLSMNRFSLSYWFNRQRPRAEMSEPVSFMATISIAL